MKFVRNRIDDIINDGFLNGKTVLEFGCVGMGEDDEQGGVNWIHERAKRVAKKIIGLDYNKKEVERLRRLGYDIRYQNVEEKFDLKEKFDVILAEEILEHLNNPGKCFENFIRHLKPKGKLIITTPHAQSVSFFLQRLFHNQISGVSITDHTLWYDATTLETILKRYGFKVKKVWYVQPLPIETTWKSLIIRFVYSFLPDRVGRNLCCIAER